MSRTFVIDGLPENASRYRNGYAVVAVDVIRATTTAISAVSMGRACYPVESVDAAFHLARKLQRPLLAGEIRGEMPYGFEINNSPAELAERRDTVRPLILVSSSGTPLILSARGCEALYLACFRNSAAIGRRLARTTHQRIALLGAGSRGEFREEDQICCAWIGAHLTLSGFVPKNESTARILNRWANARPADCLISRSAEYLKRTGQMKDLHFILDKIDDLDQTFILQNDEVVMESSCRQQSMYQPPLSY